MLTDSSLPTTDRRDSEARDPAAASTPGREQSLMRALVDLADTLIADYDPLEGMHRLVEHVVHVLDIDAAGLLLSDASGRLQVAAASEHSVELLEILQVEVEQGPCTDAYRTGVPVQSAHLAEQSFRWPRWAPTAVDCGFAAVAALPLRLRETTIGALNLLRREPVLIPAMDLQAAQALADIATIGVLQQRAVADGHTTVAQLQRALDSRIVIEQAKGVIAERLAVSPAAAFTLLHTHARSRGIVLTTLASAVVEGHLDLSTLTATARPQHVRRQR